ncbi:OLC1v1037006C1 [Oldenlandia corymbosa var. corymbosa]|uniref:OLC1v1037006C1 n=1 Tax=Oldenlandia corymbosa var. corymbosa TaxID=529605 RepID=A0AAV1CXJ7_OLDCO|nr:OLC1v1037006C1 [Oldenlandia corymbosa var. corymbosa]
MGSSTSPFSSLANLDSFFHQIITEASRFEPNMSHYSPNSYLKNNNSRFYQTDHHHISLSPSSSSSLTNKLKSLKDFPLAPPVLNSFDILPTMANNLSSSRTYGHKPHFPDQNNENPAIQADNNLLAQLENSRHYHHNSIHNQFATPNPIENINKISNSVQANRSLVSSFSSGEGSRRDDRVSRRTRSRAQCHNMYHPRQRLHYGGGSSSSSRNHQPQLNQCRCIEKTQMEGPILSSPSTCPIHESNRISNLSLVNPLAAQPPLPPVVQSTPPILQPRPPPPLPPAVQLIPPSPGAQVVHWKYGSIPAHQCFGELVRSPWNSGINEGLDWQRSQIHNAEWNASLTSITSSNSQILQIIPNQESETSHWQHFNLEPHSQGIGMAGNLESSSFLVQGQSIQSIPTITSPIISTARSVMLHDEIRIISTQEGKWENQDVGINQMTPFFEMERVEQPTKVLFQIDEELNPIIYQGPVQVDCHNKALQISPSMIPSSSFGIGLSNRQTTTSIRNSTSEVDAEKNKNEEEVGGSQGSTKLNERRTEMNLQIETNFERNDPFLGEDELFDLINWPDHQMMGNTDRFGFEI